MNGAVGLGIIGCGCSFFLLKSPIVILIHQSFLLVAVADHKKSFYCLVV